MYAIVIAFVVGVLVTMFAVLVLSRPPQNCRARTTLPENMYDLVRDIKTDTNFGHYLILPALCQELEGQIAGDISLERVNVYRSKLIHPSASFTLWRFDIQVSPETIIRLFDLAIEQIQRQKARQLLGD